MDRQGDILCGTECESVRTLHIRIDNLFYLRIGVFPASILHERTAVKEYPNQWISLISVKWKNDSNVDSAVVKYTNKSSGDLFRLQLIGELGL